MSKYVQACVGKTVKHHDKQTSHINVCGDLHCSILFTDDLLSLLKFKKNAFILIVQIGFPMNYSLLFSNKSRQNINHIAA